MEELFIPHRLVELLKKKGCPMPGNVVCANYDIDGNVCPVKIIDNTGVISSKMMTPPIDHVLYWLRKEKMLHVVIELIDKNTYAWYIQMIGKRTSKLSSHINNYYESWGECVVASIEYMIDNLI